MGKAIMFDSQTKMKTTKYDASPDEMRKNSYERLMVQFAGTFIGQAILMQFEKMLWSLEKTATWISNNKTVGRKGKASASLVRPLPWIVFLPTLVILRYTRIFLSLAAICFGFDEIEASTMVVYFHDASRYIHKIRRDGQLHGSTQKENRSFYSDIIGKALANGLSSVCAWPMSCHTKIQNNKTLLDLNIDDVLENGSNTSDDYESTDAEDQDYRELLNETFCSQSDDGDVDYLCENGSSIESSESSQNENSFYEDGEIEALKEDVNRYNGREIVLDSNTPKINGDKSHESNPNDLEPTTTSCPKESTPEASDQPSDVDTTTNSHNKDNGKKILKPKGKHNKKK